MDTPSDTLFPPFVTAHRLREREHAFEHAMACAARNAAGAGDLFYVGRFETIELALVLEPQEPLIIARKIFFAGMNALADALAVLSSPEKPITFRYPGTLMFDGALVGGGRLGILPDGAEDAPPDFLVFGAMIRAGGIKSGEGGHSPHLTTLDDEGFEHWSPQAFSASFARHFMVGVDSWLERGFRAIGPDYLARLPKGHNEERRGIDENGDLLMYIKGKNAPQRRTLAKELARPAWLDPLLKEVVA